MQIGVKQLGIASMGARMGNRFAKGNRGGGRPTLYKSKYAEIARRMCAQGATRADLADRFGVSVNTVVAWQLEHQEFSDSCKQGRQAADERVEQSFYERAVGYTYDSEKLLVVQGEVVREPIKEHVPPDPRAAEFWLRNRRPDRWKDIKQLETRVAEDDPLLAYLKSINGRVLRPVEQAGPPVIEAEYSVLRPKQNNEDAPPRPIGKP
jgi:Helix-turn-helix domain of resolvase